MSLSGVFPQQFNNGVFRFVHTNLRDYFRLQLHIFLSEKPLRFPVNSDFKNAVMREISAKKKEVIGI